MISGDFTNPVSTLDAPTKDIKLGLSLGESVDANMPLGELCAPFFTEGQEFDFGGLDSAAVYKVFEHREGGWVGGIVGDGTPPRGRPTHTCVPHSRAKEPGRIYGWRTYMSDLQRRKSSLPARQSLLYQSRLTHASPRICGAGEISGFRYGARGAEGLSRIGRNRSARGGAMPKTTFSKRAVRKRSLKPVFPSDPKGETLARVRLEEGHAHGPGNHQKMKIIQFSINIDKFTVFFDKFLKNIREEKKLLTHYISYIYIVLLK